MPRVVLSIVMATQSSPPACLLTSSSSYAELRALSRGVHSIPAAMVLNLSEAAGLPDGKLPSKVRIALLDAAALSLAHLFVPADPAKSPWQKCQNSLVKHVGNTLVHTDRNLRLAAG